MKPILNLAMIYMVLAASWVVVSADYVDPTAKTNVNAQSDLFEKSVGNPSLLQRDLEAGKDEVIRAAGSPRGIENVADKSQRQIEEEAAGLSRLKPDELTEVGREAMLRENVLEELYIDEEKPLFAAHAKDAKAIADASGALLDKLSSLIKELGIDCRTVRGDKEVEPAYYIEVRKEQSKDTRYNQKICEELRSQYACSDSVALRCSRTGFRYGSWQDREMAIDGPTLYWHHMDWGWSVKWKNKRHGWHVDKHHPWSSESSLSRNPQAINDQARGVIATRLGVAVDQIHPEVIFPCRGVGSINPLHSRWRVAWEHYIFKYKYRDRNLVCEQWAEDWTERCTIR